MIINERVMYMRYWKFLLLLIICWCWPFSASAQILLPNGQQQFTDNNGVPLAAGKVYFYIPGTTTAKFTYQDQGETTPNSNPVVLNAAGRATIWGEGLYREVVYDQFGNLIWDQITGEIASSSPSAGAPMGGFGAQTSLTSGATTSLGTVASHNVLITGATTINSFGTGATVDAPIYLVEFSGALELTYNAVSMQLPGAADIQTAAGDVALVEYLGSGNWKIGEYYRASGEALISSTGHNQVFTAGGTFTFPANITTDTQFKFTVVGGGGGAGGTTGGSGAGCGAGSGVLYVSGMTPGGTATVVVGAGGTTTTGTGTGGSGGNSSVTIGSNTYTANGGGGGTYSVALCTRGTASGFGINMTGGYGAQWNSSATFTGNLQGGSAMFGNGGPGAGGNSTISSGSPATLSAGQGGIVIVEWTR